MPNKIFRYPRWVVGIALFSTCACIFGTLQMYPSTLSLGLGTLALIFMIGLLDTIITHVQLTPEKLIIKTLFKHHTVEKSNIAKASWAKSCPAIIELTSGQLLKLPPINDSLSVTNSIRTWLKTA